MNFEHDEKKIEEILVDDKRPFGFDADKDQIRWAMQEYAEHIRKQTIEEVEAKIENMDIQVGSPCKPVANMVKTAIIKHLQRHHE